jgi:hypothetical protein
MNTRGNIAPLLDGSVGQYFNDPKETYLHLEIAVSVR